MSTDDPQARAVTVELVACGVCETDQWSGAPHGHEWIGRVLDVSGPASDADDPQLVVGNRVLTLPYISCQKCRRCLRGLDHLCFTPERLAIEYGVTQVALPPSALVQVPDSVTDAAATTASCALASGLSALRRSGLRTGDRVGVTSLDTGLGAQVALIARTLGATVSVRCRDEATARLAAALGVEQLEPGHSQSFIALVDTGGEAWDEEVEICRGGSVVLLGSDANHSTHCRLAASANVSLIRDVRGSHREVAEVLAMMARGQLRPAVGRTVGPDVWRQWTDHRHAELGPGRIVAAVAQSNTSS